MNRRGFLGSSTAIISMAAGCTFRGDLRSSDETTTDPSGTATTRTTPVLHSNDSAYTNRFAPHGAWSAPGYTAERCGYNPDTTPPRTEPGAAWLRTPFRDHRTFSTTPSVTDSERVYVGSGSGEDPPGNQHGGVVAAFDGKTGERAWRTNVTAGHVEGVVRSGETILAVSRTYEPATATLTALTAADGTRQWHVDLAVNPYGQPAVIDNRAYVTSIDDGLTAFSLDGTHEWDRNVAAGDEHASTSACANESSVFVATDHGKVVAFSTDDGHEQWRTEVVTENSLPRIQSLPTVADGTVFVTGTDYRLHAVDAADGSAQWETRLSKRNAGNAIPSATVVGDTVYVCTMNGGLIALDRSDGSKRWQAGNSGGSQPPAAAADLVVVPTHGSIEAFDSTGDHRWSFDLPTFDVGMAAYIMNPDVALAHDRVYVSLHDGRLFSLSAASSE